MLVSAFFSEAGNELIGTLLKFGKPGEKLRPYLAVKQEWSDSDFKRATECVRGCDVEVTCTAENLLELKALLKEKRLLLFIMLENPNLLEHETFTDALWAVFHITDELMARESFDNLPESDIRHLEYDIKRVYSSVLVQWIGYMRHLKADYSYLFSLEARKNLFAGGGSVIVK